MADHWIQQAIPASHKGLLHKELGVPQGQTIPPTTLERAVDNSDPTLARRARLAETLKKLNHGAR